MKCIVQSHCLSCFRYVLAKSWEDVSLRFFLVFVIVCKFYSIFLPTSILFCSIKEYLCIVPSIFQILVPPTIVHHFDCWDESVEWTASPISFYGSLTCALASQRTIRKVVRLQYSAVALRLFCSANRQMQKKTSWWWVQTKRVFLLSPNRYLYVLKYKSSKYCYRTQYLPKKNHGPPAFASIQEPHYVCIVISSFLVSSAFSLYRWWWARTLS